MTASTVWLCAALRSHQPRTRPRLRPPRRMLGDRGEGVISAAIAVLIMALLGALMWISFQAMWTRTESRTNSQLERISSGP